MWDAYDTGRVWYVPPRVRMALGRLRLDKVLTASGEADLRRLLQLIERTDWSTVPRYQECRTRGPSLSPGRSTREAGDFIYADPTTGEAVPSHVSRWRRAQRQAAHQEGQGADRWTRAFNTAPKTFAEAEAEAVRAESLRLAEEGMAQTSTAVGTASSAVHPGGAPQPEQAPTNVAHGNAAGVTTGAS